MKSILIDPTTQTCVLHDFDGEFESIARLLECSWVERVQLTPATFLYIDEEGLLAAEPKPFFRLPKLTGDTTFCGRGLIVVEYPDSGFGDVVAACEEYFLGTWGFPPAAERGSLIFPRVRFTGFHDSESIQNHPVFGPVTTFTRKAIFEDLP